VIDALTRFVVAEGVWLPIAMLLAALACALSSWRSPEPVRSSSTILRMMNLFYGCTIGVMACGHFAAVSARLAQGTLRTSAVLLYVIGLLFGIPAWRLAFLSRSSNSTPRMRTELATLNGLLFGILTVLGLVNIPIAVPALLNLGYQFHTRRYVGSALVVLTIATHLALFAGGVAFMASGVSFEEFRQRFG